MFGKKSAKKKQNPAPEAEQEARKLKSALGADRVFAEGLGDAWGALTGRNPAEIIPQVVATVLHEGGTRPSWQWQNKGNEYVFMAWPKEQPCRAAVLMAGPEGEKLVPITAVPLLQGLPNDLEVAGVHPRSDGQGADVACAMGEGQNPMWFFDPFYMRDQADLTSGITHTFWLAGLAFGLRKALLDEVSLTQGPEFELFAEEWLKRNPDKQRKDLPPLKIDVRGKHLIMPGKRYGEYQMRATILKVDDYQLETMPGKVLHLQFPMEDRPPLALALYASRFILKDYEPAAGDEIDAYVWFQGRIIDLEAPGAKIPAGYASDAQEPEPEEDAGLPEPVKPLPGTAPHKA